MCYMILHCNCNTLHSRIERGSKMGNSETKPRSYRLTPEVHDKISEIALEVGGTKEQVIGKLIEAYELQKEKVTYPDQQENIETFENYSNILTKMYLASIETGKNTKDLVRAEFSSQLQSKDQVIQDLQEKLKELKETEAAAVTNYNVIKSDNAKLQDDISNLTSDYQTKLNDLQAQLADKEKLNEALTATINQYDSQKEKIAELDAAHEENKKQQNVINDLKKEIEQQQLQHEKDMLALEKQLQKEKIEEIEKYQKMYMELLQKHEQEQQKKTTSSKTKKTTTLKNEGETN